MRLIYSYNSKVNTDPTVQKVYRELYSLSINKSRELGYITEIYSDVDWFSPYVNTWHRVEEDSTILWDSFKFIPLANTVEDFLLLDGDIILHNRLELDQSYDVVFDTYELNNWNLLYKETVNTLDKLGIVKVIPEWNTKPVRVFNCGILKLNNKELKNLYTLRWNDYHTFIKQHADQVDLYNATAVGAQFLLTLLVNHYNYSYINYSDVLGQPNKSYHHIAGKNKFNRLTSIV